MLVRNSTETDVLRLLTVLDRELLPAEAFDATGAATALAWIDFALAHLARLGRPARADAWRIFTLLRDRAALFGLFGIERGDTTLRLTAGRLRALAELAALGDDALEALAGRFAELAA